VPSLRVLSVALLVGMGATASAVGGVNETDSHVRSGLVTARPSASASSTAAAVTGALSDSQTPQALPSSGAGFDVAAENQRAGTADWRITKAQGSRPGLAGYAGAVSVLPGQSVPLSVSGDGPVRIRALRIGWYGGLGARQVWQGTLRAQPETGAPGQWPARGLADTTGWPEGHYLLRLDQGDASRYLPLTVRSADNRDRIVVLTSPLTWQAENTPAAPAGTAPAPLPKISFNRPYAAGAGAGGFLQHDAGIVQVAERTGQKIGFVTDHDVAADPSLLNGAAAVLVGGDSQYWTASLRKAVRAAGDDGTNLAFFGAGTGARRIRLVDDGRALQISRAAPAASVKLTGLRPSCSAPASGGAGWVVGNADWWGYRGTGVQTGDVLPRLLGNRVDRAATSAAGSPAALQVLSFSHVPCASAAEPVAHSGVYFVRPSGAGVFATGVGRWACALADSCTTASGKVVRLDRNTTRVVTRVTRNVIKGFATAKAGGKLTATDNASQYPALR
jgi:hypothetical protein